MIGLEFGEPESRALSAGGGASPSGSGPAFFAQTIVLPLFHRHRILTQVAADDVNIIKLLPDPRPSARRRSTSSSRPSTTCSRRAPTRWAARRDDDGHGARGSMRPAPRRPAPTPVTSARVIAVERRRPRRRHRRRGVHRLGDHARPARAAARWSSRSSSQAPSARIRTLARRPRASLVTADIADAAAPRRRLGGARFCFHIAARYAFWPKDPDHYYTTNVEGSRDVVAAARRAGVERICYTSSVATIGLQRTRERRHGERGRLRPRRAPLRELQAIQVRGGARGAAPRRTRRTRRAHASDLPRGARRPPTDADGQAGARLPQRQVPGYVDTTLNVVHVDDLALGHVLALERGRQGTSYVLGGENLSMASMLELLAGLTGLRAPTLRVPTGLTVLAARG